jgi:glucosamine-6-phosphate deaminase
MSSASFSLHTHHDRVSMGGAAAKSAASTLRKAIDERGSARMIAAAAPSQLDVYNALAVEPDIDWSVVTVLHMDEYLGLPASAPQRFGNWLRSHLVDLVNPDRFLAMRTELGEVGAIADYEGWLREGPIDLVCLGIGVNGHIAFNDPPDARFDDPLAVRVVRLDEASRIQQVDDECFETLEEVPTHALTLTIPALLAGSHLVCAVPGERKAEAVRALVEEPIDTSWPCTILRRHPHCEVHVDRAASARVRAAS